MRSISYKSASFKIMFKNANSCCCILTAWCTKKQKIKNKTTTKR